MHKLQMFYINFIIFSGKNTGNRNNRIRASLVLLISNSNRVKFKQIGFN